MARYIKITCSKVKRKKNSFSWMVVDSKRKTNGKPNTLYFGVGYDRKSTAVSAAMNHNKNLKKPLDIK